MNLEEYNVIASSVRLDEIPPAYRRLPFLGRGATTLAFEKDPSRVLIFTRDQIKIEWLRDGLRLIDHYQVVNPVRGHHIRGMANLPLYMIEMPKLYPLGAANKKIVTRELRDFAQVTREVGLERGKNWEENLSKVVDRYEDQYPHSVILPLLAWLMNYDPDQFYLDLGSRQFKQTDQAQLVLLDPIVSSELMDIINKRKAKF